MRSIAPALTVGLLLATAPAPTLAQGTPGQQQPGLIDQGLVDPRRVTRTFDEMGQKFSEIDNARASDNCIAHVQALNDAERALNAAFPPAGDAEYNAAGAAMIRAWRTRIAAERARPCGSAQPEDATMADLPVTGPLGPELPRSPPPPSLPLSPPPPPPAPATQSQPAVRPVQQGVTQDEAQRAATVSELEGWIERLERAQAEGRCADKEAILESMPSQLSERGAFLTPGYTIGYNSRRAALRALECVSASRQLSMYGNFVQISGGYGETTIPRANYGFNRAGAATPEEPGGFSETRFPALVFEAGGEFRGIHRVRLGYRQGDARNRTEIAPSTTGGAQGIVGEAPSGATGVAGNLGLRVDTEVQSREFYGAYDYIFGDRALTAVSQGRTSLRGFVGIRAAWRVRDHLGVSSITRTTAPAISVVQTLDQRVNEYDVGAALGGEVLVPLGTNFRFGLTAEMVANYYEFNGRFTENRVQNIGALSDQAFTRVTRPSESGVSYGGRVRGEVVWHYGGGDTYSPIQPRRRESRIARPVELFLGADAYYFRDRSDVNNLFSGNQVLAGQDNSIGTNDVSGWQVMAGVRFPF